MAIRNGDFSRDLFLIFWEKRNVRPLPRFEFVGAILKEKDRWRKENNIYVDFILFLIFINYDGAEKGLNFKLREKKGIPSVEKKKKRNGD